MTQKIGLKAVIGIAITLIIVSLSLYCWRRHSEPSTAASAGPGDAGQAIIENSSPVVRVKTVPLNYGRMNETLTTHGIVEPLPSTIETYNVTYECLVASVLVTGGEVVNPGDLLLRINPSPDTQLLLEQVQNELESARLEEELLNDRIKLQLSTKQDMVPVQLRISLAEKRLSSFKERGVESMKEIRAASAGIVYFIGAQPGQTLPAGTNLLQLAHEDQIIVRLGVESEDVNRLQKGQLVKLKPILAPDSKSIEGIIQTVTRQVDPSTRLVSVLVKPISNDGLLLNDYIEGKIIISSGNALLAPREAILPDGGGQSLFTVREGHAVKHVVEIGLETSGKMEIISKELKEGDPVVVLGNYELSDGMLVLEERKP
ncbi:MAG: efflux RND transporter periplasmic adaptor subunit [Candidatus Scalindua sp.]|nr:efflux RND transporter periplasmic adaptor subunit [Candidatus Scalindua sp.]